MDSVLRLLLRFIVVPLGYLAAVIAGACIILFGSWKAGAMMLSDNPDAATAGLFGFVIAGPILLIMLLATMWLPSAIGILISEVLAIRSWIFHALNGAVSGWIGWQLLGSDPSDLPLNEPKYVIAAGLAGGFAYWAVAGWSAGFWKPVFARRFPAPQPPGNPFNPPARTEV
jgi:hypothetical protein